MTTRPLHALFIAFLLGTIALAGSGFGCSTNALSEDEQNFTVAEVDSLDVPAQISSTDTLSVHFYGTVGQNGCYSLDHIEEDRSAGEVTLIPVVRHRTGVACTMAIVPLDARYRVLPPFEEGTLEILVPQPEAPDVTATVTVH